jgi:hypothetical protein
VGKIEKFLMLNLPVQWALKNYVYDKQEIKENFFEIISIY